MKKQRILTIHHKFRSRTYDDICIPEIRLEGKWLETLGFTSGNKVVIEAQENKLMITLQK